MKIKDLIKLPDKREMPKYKDIAPCDSGFVANEGYYINMGYNKAIDEISEIEIEVDSKKLEDFIYSMRQARFPSSDIVKDISNNLKEFIKVKE